MAALERKPKGPGQAKCFNCGKVGHVKMECPDLHPEVRKHLKKEFEARRLKRLHKGNSIAAISFGDYGIDELEDAAGQFSFLIDSGSEVNVVRDQEAFLSIEPTSLDSVQPVGPASLRVRGKGTIQIRIAEYVDRSGRKHPVSIEIPNCYHVPDCPINILSTHAIKEQNMFLHTAKDGDTLVVPGFHDQAFGVTSDTTNQSRDSKGSPILAIDLKYGGKRPMLYAHAVNKSLDWFTHNAIDVVTASDEAYDVAAVTENAVSPAVPDVSSTFLAHIATNAGISTLELMSRSNLYGPLNIVKDQIKSELQRCHGCKVASHETGSRAHNDQTIKREDATHPGAWLHIDVMGPVVPVGVGHARYLLVVVDEYSLYIFVSPLRKKSQVYDVLVEIIEHVNLTVLQDPPAGSTRKPEYIHGLRSDKGGEFRNDAFAAYCRARSINVFWTGTGEHKSNGLVERKIGLLSRMMRQCMLPSGLTGRLWPEAAQAMVHAMNHVPSTTLIGNRRKTYVEERLDSWVEMHKVVDVTSDSAPSVPRGPAVQGGGVSRSVSKGSQNNPVPKGIKKTNPAGGKRTRLPDQAVKRTRRLMLTKRTQKSQRVA